MTRADLAELHYITPIANVASILVRGILSHARSAGVTHDSVAMEEIQARRAGKTVPGARALHEYVNLYFDAHNPMLSRLRRHNNELCILRVSAAVLYIPGVIIADRNAASDYVRFFDVADGLTTLNKDRVFAAYWTHPDEPFADMAHKSEKCAEVLVPDVVAPKYISGAIVAGIHAQDALRAASGELAVLVKSSMFFRVCHENPCR
jgi:hypothetical protein